MCKSSAHDSPPSEKTYDFSPKFILSIIPQQLYADTSKGFYNISSKSITCLYRQSDAEVQIFLSLFLYKLHNTPGTKNNRLTTRLGNNAFADSGKTNGHRHATNIPDTIAANPAVGGTNPLKKTINVNGKNIPAPLNAIER